MLNYSCVGFKEPLQRVGLNTIKHLSDELENLCSRPSHLRSVSDLINAAAAEWVQISTARSENYGGLEAGGVAN